MIAATPHLAPTAALLLLLLLLMSMMPPLEARHMCRPRPIRARALLPALAMIEEG